MVNNLKAIYEKAKNDAQFLQELIVNPAKACENTGINLNPTERKILEGAIKKSQNYMAEQLYLISQAAEVLDNRFCLFMYCDDF